MMEVLEFAADLHSQGDTLGAVGWVRLLGSLRSPTNAVIFKLRFLPVTVIRAPGDAAKGDFQMRKPTPAPRTSTLTVSASSPRSAPRVW